MTKSPRYFASATPLVFLVGLLPALLMSTARGGSTVFFLIVVFSLIAVCTLRIPESTSGGAFRNYWFLLACIALTALATLATQATHGIWYGSELERALRLALGLPIVLTALLRLERRHLHYAAWGVAAACWTTAQAVFFLSYASTGRPETEEYNAVSYGNLMLLFGVLVVFSLGWQTTRYKKTEAALKVITAVAVFYGFLLTQTRTGWMAVPVFILIGVALFNHRATIWKSLITCVAIMALAAAAGFSSQALRDRAMTGVHEVTQCEASPLTNSSMCIRLQLWHAAWRMFSEQPVFGVGGGKQFTARLQADARQGIISPFVATNFGEAHSDMLYTLATTGLVGGLALLLAYFVPAWTFLKRLRHRDLDNDARVAAAMGLALCLGFAIFGLTELMFRGMRTVSFYAVFLAWFLAASHSATLRPPSPRSQST